MADDLHRKMAIYTLAQLYYCLIGEARGQQYRIYDVTMHTKIYAKEEYIYIKLYDSLVRSGESERGFRVWRWGVIHRQLRRTVKSLSR